MTIEEVRQLFTKNGTNSEEELDLLRLGCLTSKNNSFTLDDQGNLTVNSINANSSNISNTTDFNAIYPVGSVYISVSSTNPSTLFGGTWESFGIGRTLVGVDTSQTEFNTVQKTGGSKFLQRHNHSGSTGSGKSNFMRVVGSAGTSVNDNHSVGYSAASYVDKSGTNIPGGAHYHEFTTNNAGTGESGNLQPYITVYMWKRIA